MKKNYLSIIFTSILFFAFSQQKQVSPNEMLYSISNNQISLLETSSTQSSTIIWQNDFSDASDWTFSNTSIPPLDWSIETNSDLNALNVNTALPPALTPLVTTTLNNGFLFISSDATGGGDNDGTPVEATATISEPIDLSAWPYVQISFEHNYRWWQDTRAIRVSGDNGLTWTDFTITDQNGYPNLQNSGNPEVTTYNISSVAGGQDSVLIQFYYFDHDIWAWYWAVDDVVISEIPDNALEISEEVQGGWWQGYLTSGGDGYDYTQKPLSQLTGNPYSFEAVLRNAGLAPQNTYLNVEVKDYSGSVVYSDVSNTLLLDLSYPQDTFVANSTYSPTSTGVYDITMWGIGDSATTNMVNLQTTVTDYIYARDEGTPDGYWRVGRSCGGMVLGVKYDMYADETLYAIDVHVADNSVPGTNMYAILYEADAAGGDPIYLTQTDDYTITAADLGNWVSIPFDGGEQVYNGTGYVAAVAGYANPIDTFQVSVSGLSQAGCYIQDNGCDIGSGGFGYWYTTSDIPMIRMNFNQAVLSIDEIFIGDVAIHPNPNNGIFGLEINNALSGTYHISVSSVLGQEVYIETKNLNGNLIDQIDLSNVDKGVYLLEVNYSDSKFVEKIIIE